MAAVTMNARLTAFTKQGSIFRRTSGQELDGKTNGSLTIFLTCIVTKDGQTAPDLAPCAYNEVPDGIVTGLANDATSLSKDAGDPIADNINILYRDVHKDDEFLLTIGAGKGAVVGELALVDHDTEGFAENMAPAASSIAAVPPFRILGRWMATYTAVASKCQLGWCKGK